VPDAVSAFLETARDDELCVITLNRPEKRNALTTYGIRQLTRALRSAEADARVRGVILAGAGPSFCAGVDLREFAHGTPISGNNLIRALAEVCDTARGLTKPVAVAVQGHCLGGALELAACADLRICTPDARFGMPEVWLGIPSVIDAVMLPLVVGAGRARELLLTGDPIDASTALSWGLVNAVAPLDQLLEATAQSLRRITRHDPEVIAAQKRLHQQWLDLAYSDAIEVSISALLEAFSKGRPQRAALERLGAWQDQPDTRHTQERAEYHQ
jgi:enoyl-CoA hydratase